MAEHNGVTVFLADLHLRTDSPQSMTAFRMLMERCVQRAGAVYILGDLFEYWAGDDDDGPVSTEVAQILSAVDKEKMQIFFIAGNRDFLLGETYAQKCGITILPDPSLIQLDGQPVLLSHGDMLCTDDAVYQQFRQQIRQSAWQQGFLKQPLAVRKQIINRLRERSKTETQKKDMTIMDVNQEAVEELQRLYDYAVLIHGHTHRPQYHAYDVDGHRCERFVLDSWDNTPSCLVWSDGRFTVEPLEF